MSVRSRMWTLFGWEDVPDEWGQTGATVPPEMQMPEGDDIEPTSEWAPATPTAPRLLSPAEVRRIRTTPARDLVEIYGPVIARLCDSHDLLTAAITALSPEEWESVADVTNFARDPRVRKTVVAISRLAAICKQLQEGGAWRPLS